MEIWYDPNTLEIKAVYSHQYQGSAWQSQGLLKVEMEGARVPRDFAPGAIINISGPNPVITSLAPPPVPDARQVRVAELTSKLGNDSINDDELRELLKLERGL